MTNKQTEKKDKQTEEKKPYIVSLLNKTKRPNKEDDKTEIFQQHIGPKANFLDVASQPLGFMPPADPDTPLVLDINDFNLPTLFASLTSKEVTELKRDNNIASVIEDGKGVYPQGFSYLGMPSTPVLENIESQRDVKGPSPMADGVPWGINRVKAPVCWEATQAKGIYVAILDTGIAPHNDLQGNLLGGISFVPGQSWVDEHGHGTHVAGTVGARINGFGVVGVAPAAYLYAIKVLPNSGPGNWSWLMAGLYWMRKNFGCVFDVANMSLGGIPPADTINLLKSYVDYAAQNTLLVAAAGNSGGQVIYPARYPNCIAVSAIDDADTIAGFSCRGPEVDLCAPGTNVYSTLPNNSYGTLSGTSMASPHVAGAAALCRGTHRLLDMDEIKNLLIKHADNLGSPGRDNEYGHGRVDCYGATFDKSCG